MVLYKYHIFLDKNYNMQNKLSLSNKLLFKLQVILFLIINILLIHPR